MDSSIHAELDVLRKHLSTQDIRSAERAKDVEYIKETVIRIENDNKAHYAEDKTYQDFMNKRVGKSESQIQKMTIYWTVALSLAMFLSQLLSKFIDRII